MTETNDIIEKELQETIHVICPTCEKSKGLKIPTKIVNQSKQLTTVSIPSGVVCEHSFQSFVDKNFVIRGYQKVDFDFSQMEFYERRDDTAEAEVDDPIAKLSSLPLFQDIINLLRDLVDGREILGSGIFTVNGHVLYSSLPSNTLFTIMKEFEVRTEKKLSNLKKMFLELENNQKIFSSYIEIQNMRFAVTLFFSQTIKLGMGNLYLNDLVETIKKTQG